MAMGPIEVLVVGFPGGALDGEILPALEDVVERGIVSIVDCLLISKDETGDVGFVELEDMEADENVTRLSALIDEANGLLSAEDVDAFARALDPGDSAAALVLEHIWAEPFREALVDSGGALIADIQVPGFVADEVLAAVEG